MAIPSGGGSEVLKRGTLHTLSSSWSTFKFDGDNESTAGTNDEVVPADHIITILNFTLCEQGGQAEIIQAYIYNGANNVYLLTTLDLPAEETFVWNDKIVLMAGDRFHIKTNSAADVDCYYSFIDQDWT